MRFRITLYMIFFVLNDNDCCQLFDLTGAPCDDFNGYCDVFYKCRGVDADGPLAKLKDLLFSKESIESVRKWVTVSVFVLPFSLIFRCQINNAKAAGDEFYLWVLALTTCLFTGVLVGRFADGRGLRAPDGPIYHSMCRTYPKQQSQ